MSIDFLSIGHACHDWTPKGFIPGGAVTYSSLLAKKLGLSAAILTSVGSDYQFESMFDQIEIQNIPAEETTVFKNEYNGLARQQYLLSRAKDIERAHFPIKWKQSSMVFIGPIANEVDPKIFEAIDDKTLVAISPQGWMRRWDEQKKVFHKMLDDFSFLTNANFTIISEEDVNNDQQIIQDLASMLNILVVTKSELGCDLYINNSKHSIPAFKTTVVDSTGAGDIFAAAFLIYYCKTEDYIKAAQYATIAASYCIEANGILGIPNQERIEYRLAEYLK